MNGFMKTYEVETKAKYSAIEQINPEGLYLIKETGEIYFGVNRYGASVEFFETALPAIGVSNVLYVVKSGSQKGLHAWNGTAFQKFVDFSVYITADSVTEFTNKTLDLGEGNSNSIKNADISIFKAGTLKTAISEESTDLEIATAKATYDFISTTLGSVHIQKGGVDMSDVGTTFNNAKIGYTYDITAPGDFMGVDFNIGDLIIFVNNVVSGTVKRTDFIHIDNTEAPNILRKLAGATENNLVSFNAEGGIKDSGLKTTTQLSSESTDLELVTAKTLFDLFKVERI